MSYIESKLNELGFLKTNKVLLAILGLATLLFIIGIFLPMITLTKFYLAKSSFSIISGLVELLKDGKIILFILIAGFSIVFPLLKISVLYKMLSAKSLNTEKLKKHLHLMHEYGRWAMLDVMVVAILIVTVKLGAIASIKVHIGLYVFGAAVLLIMFVTHYSVKYFDKQASITTIQESITTTKE